MGMASQSVSPGENARKLIHLVQHFIYIMASVPAS